MSRKKFCLSPNNKKRADNLQTYSYSGVAQIAELTKQPAEPNFRVTSPFEKRQDIQTFLSLGEHDRKR